MKLYALRGKKFEQILQRAVSGSLQKVTENGNDWLPFSMHFIDTAASGGTQRDCRKAFRITFALNAAAGKNCFQH